jgi:type II secretory pathway component PulK
MQQPAYQCKCEVFETVDELRLVYGADMDTLVGEDANRNGILDPNETDESQDKLVHPGALEYVTVYSREPNVASNTVLIASLSYGSPEYYLLRSLLRANFTSQRSDQILSNLGLSGSGAVSALAPTRRFAGPLDFYIHSQMTAAEFAQIATNLTVSRNSVVEGRVNVNTASEPVLTCLLGGDTGSAQQLVSYRQSNPNSLTSIAWVVDALNEAGSGAVTNLLSGDYITTQTYQLSADIAAVGPHGRGYRRVKFVFDTSSGAPEIVYRQDLTHLGWALGPDVRQQLLLAKATP